MKKDSDKPETRGRKKIPDDLRRQNIARIYLTDDECARVASAAARSQEEIPVWLRRIALTIAK